MSRGVADNCQDCREGTEDARGFVVGFVLGNVRELCRCETSRWPTLGRSWRTGAGAGHAGGKTKESAWLGGANAPYYKGDQQKKPKRDRKRHQSRLPKVTAKRE